MTLLTGSMVATPRLMETLINIIVYAFNYMQASTGKQEHLYKVLVIRDLGTGKTSIIKRYVHQFFSPHYRATVSSNL